MLNARQEIFVQNMVKGMTQRQAYKEAYKVNYSDKAIDEKACVLFNSEKVQKRYKELMEQANNDAIMTAIERKKWLTKVINGELKDTVYYNVNGENTPIEKSADLNTKIKALDTLNKMSGEYVTKVEGNMNISYEQAIKEVADDDEY